MILHVRSLFSKIGEEQTNDDAEDGPPELLVSTSIRLFKTNKASVRLVYSRRSYGEDLGLLLESQ